VRLLFQANSSDAMFGIRCVELVFRLEKYSSLLHIPMWTHRVDSIGDSRSMDGVHAMDVDDLWLNSNRDRRGWIWDWCGSDGHA
jgi:hypothetical protein